MPNRHSTAKGRSERGDFEIGRLRFKPVCEAEKQPPLELVSLLEAVGSQSVLDGYANPLVYGRGITLRSPFDGGKQERDLVERYDTISKKCAGTIPNLSDEYARFAKHYEGLAKKEDLEAERERLKR